LGCASAGSSQLQVEVLPLPEVDAGLDVEVCSGAQVSLGGIANPLYTYSWLPSSGLDDPLAAQTTAQLMNNTANTVVYEYVLTANDGNCSARDTMLYSVTAPPFVSFLSQPGQCFDGHSFDFLAVGDFTPTADFIWNFGPNSNVASSSVVNPSNITFDTTGSQTISLQVNDGGCFSNLYSADVLIYPEPEANFYSEVVTGCDPLTVKFINLSEGPGNLIYEWNFGDGLPSASEEPAYTYDEPGIYDVSLNVKTIQGCASSMDRKEYIHVFPTPVADFRVSSLTASILEPEINISSEAELADTISYYIISLDTLLNDADVSFTFPDSSAEYYITQYARNQFGCEDSTTRKVEIQEGYRFYIPNSFSPNNDGINDIFKPEGEGIASFSIVIWNRWGQQLYASFDTENGWDGTTALSSRIVPPGTYIYKIETYDNLGYSYSYEGVVNVIQ
jgi:gliding motility-associated-like protein